MINQSKMTKDEMNELADIIVGKLVSKQKELDKEFIKELEDSNLPIEVHERIGEKDKIVMEITKLIVMLDAFEKAEEYEKAHVCSTRIADLKLMLSKM